MRKKGEYTNIRIEKNAYEQIAEMAELDGRSITKETTKLIEFAYKYMHDELVQTFLLTTKPQSTKGMTREEVKQTDKYKALEKEMEDLKHERWELGEGDGEVTMEELKAIGKRESEIKQRQKEIEDEMRAMLND